MLVPFIGFHTGFGFASFGVLVAAVAKTIDSFNYVTSAVLTPLFLVAATLFPISTLPPFIHALALLNPLYHCVALVRDAALGNDAWSDLTHVFVLVSFAIVMWRIAVLWQMQMRLID